MRKFIFDLDNTLIKGDFSSERQYLKDILKNEDNEEFISNVGEYLLEYEDKNYFYDRYLLSEFLKSKSGFNITPNVIDGWMDLGGGCDLIDGAVDVLEYLKKKDKKIVLLTNWFKTAQVKRLKKAGIYGYFDSIVTGDLCLKPHMSSYVEACGENSFKECVMVGDNLNKDYLAPKNLGIESFHFCEEDNLEKGKIKTLYKIKEIC